MIGLQEHWYEDSAGRLFVVYPGVDGAVFVAGPDVATSDRLERVYQTCEQMGTAFARVHCEGVARALELQLVVEARRVAIKCGTSLQLSVRPL